MITITTEPITEHWTTDGREAISDTHATAAEVNSRLARIEVADIGQQLVPFLAAAAAELAFLAGVSWRFGVDDPPVALLRMIAKVTMRAPHAGGPHTTRLLDQLS